MNKYFSKLLPYNFRHFEGLLYHYHYITILSDFNYHPFIIRTNSNSSQKHTESIYISTCLSSILFVMCIASLPAYVRTSLTFIQIFKKGQPFYILLLFVLLISFLNLCVAAIDGLGFWLEIPQCLAVGCFRITLLILTSLLVAFVCVCRCIAVCTLYLYKKMNKTSILTICSAVLLLISIILPILFVKMDYMTFKFVGPPSRIGCTPVLKSTKEYTYISFIIFFIFISDVVLLLVYLILYKKLHKKALRPCMKRLKASARKVSLSVTLSYLILHSPIVIVYTLFTFKPKYVIGIQGAVNTILLDFVLRFLSYLYSAMLPSVIAKSGSLNDKTISAAKQSVYRGKTAVNINN